MSTSPRLISFKESIELGKYELEYLSQYKVQALTNNRRQLRLQWARLANQPDFSNKPQLAAAQKKVEKALRDLDKDEEQLMIEYAGA